MEADAAAEDATRDPAPDTAGAAGAAAGCSGGAGAGAGADDGGSDGADDADGAAPAVQMASLAVMVTLPVVAGTSVAGVNVKAMLVAVCPTALLLLVAPPQPTALPITLIVVVAQNAQLVSSELVQRQTFSPVVTPVIVTLTVPSVADAHTSWASVFVPATLASAQFAALAATILMYGRLSSSIRPAVTNVRVDATAVVTLAVLHEDTSGTAVIA